MEVNTQVGLPVIYKEVKLEAGYRIDLLVDKKVIIEVKAVDEFSAIHFAQLLTYLRLSDIKLGLLLNFNVSKLTEGIKRVVNNL
ncbi:GxxExxY protein [Algoriphagus chordae]|uniref:GxxExxY protein n=1 Tax=Algoriphagus chordae TaxID=237019 RepID=A0A2W7RS97_9BACT|nr:GxxExxY protein [Algoriphagus chordae]